VPFSRDTSLNGEPTASGELTSSIPGPHPDPTQLGIYDLDPAIAERVYRGRRTGRYIAGGTAFAFTGLTVYGGIVVHDNLATGTGLLWLHLLGFLFSAFFTVVMASAALISLGRPAMRLTLDNDGFSLEYPSKRLRILRRWADPGFCLVLRDFRGHSPPAPDYVLMDTASRAPFWFRPPTSPLTTRAYDALVATASSKGLVVSLERGSSLFTLWPNTKITIKHGSTQVH